jgi:undecaprenyl diphosphate synthase
MYPLSKEKLPRHVAIIMDGNGRWAKQRLLNRLRGHEEGARSVREVTQCCRKLGIPYLTLYAFSKENWQRPPSEVNGLWLLLKRFLKTELQEMIDKEIRLCHLGEEAGIPPDVMEELRSASFETAKFDKLTLNLAINYGGRQEILRAVRLAARDILGCRIKPEEISGELFSRYLFTGDTPEPDLLIRTGGEQRISNFLLWQSAYAEFYFTDDYWPDFREPQFLEALAEYQRRERRFGKTGEQVKGTDPL